MRKGDVRMKLAFWLLAPGSLLLASVDGTVMNATTGKPQGSVVVTQGMKTLGSVKSDSDGKFKIDKDIPPGPALLQAIHQGATYNLILAPGGPMTGVHLKVYDSTAKPGVAKVSQHMILIEPSAASLDIGETFLIENESTATFLDPVNGSIQFYLPEAAGGKVKVTINSPGGMPIERPAEKTTAKDVYKITYPVKPGESRFDVSYSLPPTDTFTSKIMHADGVTRLVTPSSVTLSGEGVATLGQEPQTKAHIYNAGGSAYSVQITGVGSLRSQEAAAPDEDTGEQNQIEEKPARIYTRMYWVLGLAFAILGLGGVLLYRRSAA
jgi:hypothetical protein